MNKENWINSILGSTSSIGETDVNPYLYNKIADRIDREQEKEPAARIKPEWVVIILAVVVFNISSIIILTTKKSAHREDASMMALSGEINTGTTYFY